MILSVVLFFVNDLRHTNKENPSAKNTKENLLRT